MSAMVSMLLSQLLAGDPACDAPDFDRRWHRALHAQFGRRDTRGSLAQALRDAGQNVPRGWEGDAP